MTQLLLRQDLGKRPYRFRCRFRVPAAPPRTHYLRAMWEQELQREKMKAAAWFIRDMKLEGFLYVDAHGFTMKGPFPPIDPVTLPAPPPQLTARQMLSGVQAGKPFNDKGSNDAHLVVPLNESEDWEFELAAVFIHKTILTDYPDEHEEELGT